MEPTSHYVSIDEVEAGAGVPAFVPQARRSMFLAVAALSLLEMVAASAACARAEACHGASAWGVALGLVSAALCAAYVATEQSRADLAEGALEPAVLFLFFWWVAGVSIVTFWGPFVEVGAGYCAAWGTLGVVSVLLYGSSSAFRGVLDDAWAKTQRSAHVELLAVASAVELVAAVAACGSADAAASAGAGWAVVVGVVSLGACAGAWLSSSLAPPPLRASGSSGAPEPSFLRSPAFAMGITGWWMLSAVTLTLTSPFGTAEIGRAHV